MKAKKAEAGIFALSLEGDWAKGTTFLFVVFLRQTKNSVSKPPRSSEILICEYLRKSAVKNLSSLLLRLFSAYSASLR